MVQGWCRIIGALRRGAGRIARQSTEQFNATIGVAGWRGAAGRYRPAAGYRHCAGGDGHRAAVYALSFLARCRHQPAEALRYE